MEALLTILGGIGLVMIVILYDAFAWGFVCYKLYHWFILPVFADLPHITFGQAVGIFIFMGLFKQKIENNLCLPDGREIEEKTNWPLTIIAPWLVILAVMFIRLFI